VLTVRISDVEYLKVTAPEGEYLGGSQEWYGEIWQKRAGCGAVAASDIVWYLARRHERLRGLCDVSNDSKTGFIALMTEMFTYITPGARGVDKPEMLSDGAKRYGTARGVALNTRILSAPAFNRPTWEAVREFISAFIVSGYPVAFLNLSNGKLPNLDNWHWVTIVGLDGTSATICDGGRAWDIALGEWLQTTLLGGAFVAIY
jgi:hypothetical protein